MLAVVPCTHNLTSPNYPAKVINMENAPIFRVGREERTLIFNTKEMAKLIIEHHTDISNMEN